MAKNNPGWYVTHLEDSVLIGPFDLTLRWYIRMSVFTGNSILRPMLKFYDVREGGGSYVYQKAAQKAYTTQKKHLKIVKEAINAAR